MRTAVVLFTRDLRVHDHPALAAAVDEAETIVPLFVFDEAETTVPLFVFDEAIREAGYVQGLHALLAGMAGRAAPHP